jgi:hypothetical protein
MVPVSVSALTKVDSYHRSRNLYFAPLYSAFIAFRCFVMISKIVNWYSMQVYPGYSTDEVVSNEADT